MKLVVNNQTIQKLKDEFPHLSKRRYSKDNNGELLRAYFNDCEKALKGIVSIERTKNDENIDDYDFFKDILDFCIIKLNDEDLDLYLKDLFDSNYQINVVKTMIPNIKYDINKQETVPTLKKAIFAVKDTFEINLDHIYTLDEIVLLQNQNVIRFLALGDNYEKIDGKECFSLKHDYEKRNIVPIGNEAIDKYNYLKLINNYPYLFTYIRNNIDFSMINDLLYDYETLLSNVVNQEVDECNKKVDESLKRIDDIKKLTLHF